MEPQTLPTQDCAHVFLIAVDVSQHELSELKRLLSDEERTRADRFRLAADHGRYVVARANLRKILGSRLLCEASQVAFHYGQFGKPELASSFQPRIQFNVSHSGKWALIGISSDSPIGVDIEERREIKSIASVVKSTFSAAEFRQWLALPGSLQTEAFFRAWTCKEALIKALGTGVSLPTENVQVEIDPLKPSRLVQLDLSNESTAKWRLESFSLAHGYCAAIACGSHVTSIRVFENTSGYE